MQEESPYRIAKTAQQQDTPISSCYDDDGAAMPMPAEILDFLGFVPGSLRQAMHNAVWQNQEMPYSTVYVKVQDVIEQWKKRFPIAAVLPDAVTIVRVATPRVYDSVGRGTPIHTFLDRLATMSNGVRYFAFEDIEFEVAA